MVLYLFSAPPLRGRNSRRHDHGSAGLIGSHLVEELLKEDVAEVHVYDNFRRGTRENLGIKYEQGGTTFVTNRGGGPEAAKRDLGFEWTVGLEEGMRKLIEWRNSHKRAVAARRKAAGIE